MAEHTKGEWRAVEVPNGINQRPRLEIMAFQDNYERNICRLSVRAPEEESANAYLIAAAPELYEALKATYIWMNAFMARGGRTDGFPWMEVTQALAKAKAERVNKGGKD